MKLKHYNSSSKYSVLRNMTVSTVFYSFALLQLACLVSAQKQNNINGIDLLSSYADRRWFSLNQCDDICGVVRAYSNLFVAKERSCKKCSQSSMQRVACFSMQHVAIYSITLLSNGRVASQNNAQRVA